MESLEKGGGARGERVGRVRRLKGKGREQYWEGEKMV